MHRRSFLAAVASGLVPAVAQNASDQDLAAKRASLNEWLSIRTGRGQMTSRERAKLVGWAPPKSQVAVSTPFRLGNDLKMTDIQSDRLLIGTGYNSATGQKGGAVVQFDPDHEQQQLATAAGEQPGQRVTFNLIQVSQTEQLKDALAVSASVSFGFGIFSTDASYSFLKTGSFSSFSSYLVVDVRVRNPAQVLRHALLTDAAKRYIRTGGVRFREFAGDQYVYGRITGGQLTAIVVFNSVSTSEQQTVRTAVSAAIAGFGGGQAQFASALQQLETVSKSEIHLIRDGGIEAIPDLPGLRQAALDFPTHVSQQRSPAVIALMTDSYSSVEDLPRNFPSLAEIQKQSETLGTIAPLLDRCYQYRADLLYADLHRDEFNPYSAEEYTAAWEQNEKNITTLVGAATRVEEDPNTAAPVPPPQPGFQPVRRASAPPQPQPQPTPQWQKIFPWDRTFIGRVPQGMIGAVTLRGMWAPIKAWPRSMEREGFFCANLPMELTGRNGSYQAHIQVLSADGFKTLRDLPWTGQPITIADGPCQVYVYMPGWNETGFNPTENFRRPDCCSSEAMLVVR